MIEKEILSYYQGKIILVTGACGYVGSSLIQALSGVDCKIVALEKRPLIKDDLPRGKAQYTVLQKDIQNDDVWEGSLKGVDIVFHFAAQTSSKFSDENPRQDLQINLLPVVRFIETCHKTKARPDILFAGTATEVGLTVDYPVDEKQKDFPVTVYDIHKLTAEKYLRFYTYQMNGRSVTLRLPNIYGPGPASSSADRGVLNFMIRRALSKEKLTVYGEGKNMRDYLYIEDLTRAFLFAGAKIDALKGNYFLIGSGQGHSLKESFELVSKVVGQKTTEAVEVVSVAAPQGLSPIEKRNYVADITKFSKLTGWQPKVFLEEGIQKTAEYFLQGEKR